MSAYAIGKNPRLLYPIGQSHRKLGDLEKAQSTLKKYLALVPRAQNRRLVEEQIKELEQALAMRTEAKSSHERLATSVTAAQPPAAEQDPASESPSLVEVSKKPPPSVLRKPRSEPTTAPKSSPDQVLVAVPANTPQATITVEPSPAVASRPRKLLSVSAEAGAFIPIAGFKVNYDLGVQLAFSFLPWLAVQGDVGFIFLRGVNDQLVAGEGRGPVVQNVFVVPFGLGLKLGVAELLERGRPWPVRPYVSAEIGLVYMRSQTVLFNVDGWRNLFEVAFIGTAGAAIPISSSLAIIIESRVLVASATPQRVGAIGQAGDSTISGVSIRAGIAVAF